MKRINIYITALIIILVFVLHSLFSFAPLSANDFPYLSQGELQQRLSIPYAWWDRGSQGLGEYAIPFIWVWPMDVLYGFFAKIGFSFSMIERLLGIFPALLLGVYGMRKLLQSYALDEISIFVGTLIYLLNTYVLLLLDGGQLAFVLSYTLFPLVFVYAKRAIEINTLDSILIFAAFLGLLSFFDIRYVYITVILMGIYTVYNLLFFQRSELVLYLQKCTKIALIAGIILAGLLSYMLFPAIFARGVTLPTGYDRETQTSFLGFTTLANATLLLQPHWYKNVFGQLTPLLWYFLPFPLLAFSAPLVNKKNKIIGFWLLVSLIGIFLTKGTLEPAGKVYTWLFSNVPGFSLFRDSSKFYVFIALSYAVLSSFTVSALQKRFFTLKLIVPILTALYFLVVTFPVWTGKMTGMLSTQPYFSEFNKIQQLLFQDTTFGRVLWIPGRTPLSYADQNHPSLEASRLVTFRPFSIGIVGSYEIFNFLRDAPFIDQMLKISGIKYVVYPYPDERREELKEDNKRYYDTFLAQLTNAQWAQRRINEKPFPLIKTNDAKDRIFLAPNHFFIVGSDRVYWDLTNIEGFDLSKNALTFVEETSGLSYQLDTFPDSPILEYKAGIYDLPASFIKASDMYFPAKDLRFEPNESGWWKRETTDLIGWRAFLQEKYQIDNLDFDYQGGWAVAEGDRELRVERNVIKQGDILLARVMQSTKGGKIEYYQGETKIGETITKKEDLGKTTLITRGLNEIPDTVLEYDITKVQWDEVGVLVSDEPVTIRTEGDINVVNALSFLPQETWNAFQTKATELRLEGRAQRFEDMPQSAKEALFLGAASGSITYQRISPVQYKVIVEGVTRPQTIVFSEVFNPMWEMNGKSSIKMYSFLNGFRVNENGEYDIYFTAQRYVNYGLVVSGFTLLILLLLLFRNREKR